MTTEIQEGKPCNWVRGDGGLCSTTRWSKEQSDTDGFCKHCRCYFRQRDTNPVPPPEYNKSFLRKVVEAALGDLYERRPFKWDLPKFEENDPELWEEFLQNAEDYVRRVFREYGLKVKGDE